MALVDLDVGSLVIGSLLSPPVGPGGGTGDVIGPGTSTHNAIARYNGVTGKLLQDSGVTIDDFGNLVWVAKTGTFIGNNMTTVQRDALTPVPGYEIWNTDLEKFQVYKDAVEGWKSLAYALAGVVIVNSLSDFPPPVSDIITLESGVLYKIQGNIALGANSFVWNGAAGFEGVAHGLSGLSQFVVNYSKAMIDATSAPRSRVQIRHMNLVNIGGTVLDFFGSVSKQYDVLIQDSQLVCFALNGSAARIDGFRTAKFFNSSLSSGDNALVVLGATNGQLVVDGCRLSATDDVIALNDSVCDAVSLIGNQVTLPDAGAVFIRGEIDSANIASAGSGRVMRNTLLGTLGAALVGLSRQDVRWKFADNDSVSVAVGSEFRDTRAQIVTSAIVNAAATVISTIGVAVKLNAVFTELADSRCWFTSDATGKLTYIGPDATFVTFTGRMRLRPVSGTNQIMNCLLAVNGSVVAESATYLRRSSTDLDSLLLVWGLLLTAGDTFELFLRNDTSTINLLADHVQFMVM